MSLFVTRFPVLAVVLSFSFIISWGQNASLNASLSLSSANVTPGSSVTVPLTLSGGANPAALQWTFTYPATSIVTVTVADAAAASAAGKSSICQNSPGQTTCMLAGINSNGLADGVIENITLTTSAGFSGSAAVGVSSVIAVAQDASALASNGTGGTLTATGTPLQITALNCVPNSIAPGASSTCTVTLSAAAPTGGATVALSAGSAPLTIPASVLVPAGSASTTFTATASSSAAPQSAAITATLGSSNAVAIIQIAAPTGPQLSQLSCNPVTLLPGASASCTAGLTISAPTGGASIALTTDSSTVTAPATATVAAGTSAVTFTVTASNSAPPQSATLTATLTSAGGVSVNGTPISTTISVTAPPPQLSSLSCSPASIVAGASTTCSVNLVAAAPAPGVTITLSAGTAPISLPISVTVAPGATSASFTATASASATPQTVILNATVGTASATTSLIITSSGSGSTSSIFPANATPLILTTGDSHAVELGLRFRSDVSGFITGIKFYKSTANVGPHTGTLWTNTGTVLATGSFVNESLSGWQILTFPSPVPIAANTSYVASYHTNSGNYSVDPGFLLSKSYDNPPLHALANGFDGNNAVYNYGPGGVFPTSGYGSNYWVDVQFTTTATTSASIFPAGSTPTVVASGDANPIEVGVKFRADSNGFISGVKFYKSSANVGAHTGSLWTNTGALLATGTFANETASGWQTLMFASPVPITANTTYVASYHTPSGNYSVDFGYFSSKGVDNPPLHALQQGVDGNNSVYAYGNGGVFPVSGLGWNYWVDVVYTGGAAPPPASVSLFSPASTPAIISSGDANPIEVGVQFRSDVDGAITGVKFYKSSANVGPHTVSLWSGSSLLATATASGETASGWQSVTFPSPVSIKANTLYVASYHTASGNYSVDPAYFLYKGLDSPPLHAIQHGFGGNNAVYAYGAGGIAPVSGFGSNYWVDVSFTPTTSGGGAPPTSIFSGPIAPAVTGGDPNPIEVGVKFRADRNGNVTGIRFFKTAANVGPHTGSLWSRTGVLLATGTFTNESATGWQTLTFSSPVPITANTTYVASYHTASGNYATDYNYFINQGVDSPPLHALQHGADGNNAVYAYGPGGIFPSQGFGSNYWVDVLFQ